jgi:hypothetical protein
MQKEHGMFAVWHSSMVLPYSYTQCALFSMPLSGQVFDQLLSACLIYGMEVHTIFESPNGDLT